MTKIRKLLQLDDDLQIDDLQWGNFLISYDLIRDKDYNKIISAIKKYKFGCKPLESVWIVESEKSCFDIFNDLSKHVDPDDKLIVMSLGLDAEWKKLAPKATTWMKKTFP